MLAFALFLGPLRHLAVVPRRARAAAAAREAVHIVALGPARGRRRTSRGRLIAGWVTGRAGRLPRDRSSRWRRQLDPGDAAVLRRSSGFLAAGVVLVRARWGIGRRLVGYVALGRRRASLIAALLAVRCRRCARLGVEMRLWSASYLVYLLLVFFPQSSIFRLLVPLSPLWGAFAVPRSRVWRVGVLVAVPRSAQWWWIYNMYALGQQRSWQVP